MECSLPGSSIQGDSPGMNTGVGCHDFFQGIFPTQASNSGLLHCKWILYCLSHQESPRILVWVVILFSRGSSWSRDQIQVSCIASGFFTDLATRKAGKNVLHCVTQWWKIVLGARNCFYLMNILTHITHSKEYLAFQISVNGIPFIQGDLKS